MNRRTFLSALIPAAVAAVGAARGMMRAKPTMAETGTPSALPTEIESQDLGTVSYTMKTGSAKVSILDPQLAIRPIRLFDSCAPPRNTTTSYQTPNAASIRRLKM